MSKASNFNLLSPGVQRWLYKQKWTSLKPVQVSSIPAINKGENDLLIIAPTAGGKTEAAFLPLFSHLENSTQSGFGVICISPLKALINDQYYRLRSLGDATKVQVTPWHGDVSQSKKTKSWKKPSGVLLITPESLESLFVNRLNELKRNTLNITAIVIDEYHYFLNSERGFQLLSQLSRLEKLINKTIPRYGLSATVGNPESALRILRPDQKLSGQIISPKGTGQELELTLKSITPNHEQAETFIGLVGIDLFDRLRGSNHLIFANSRKNVEVLTDALRNQSESNNLPNEFFAHHGSIGKEERHYLESRLKEGLKPTTAIATSTLELGIDLGSVNSVAQVTPPSSVSGLRQRLGRSGRRGEPARLRLYVEGQGHHAKSECIDKLELPLLQTIAVLELLFSGWLEPSDEKKQHYSTLVQQILSSIAYTGSTTAQVLHQTLIQSGPWELSQEEFVILLRAMGTQRLIKQANSGELLIGDQGEKILNRYDFFTTFSTPDEYRLLVEGKPLGTLPSIVPYVVGQLVIFAGRRWIVIGIDTTKLVINLKPAGAGMAPKFDGEAAPVHAEIRKKMFSLYQSGIAPAYCDEVSGSVLSEARNHFWNYQLDKQSWIRDGKDLYWFVWSGDRVINTIVLLLTVNKFEASAFGPVICISTGKDFKHVLERLASVLEPKRRIELNDRIKSKPIGKFDHALTEEVIHTAYLKEMIDIDGVVEYLRNYDTISNSQDL